MSNIIELNEYKSMKREVARLKDQVTNRLVERDQLKLVICKNIKHCYMLEFGSLEYECYELSCTYQKLRRQKDLMQIQINHQQVIDRESLLNQLSQEFEQYLEKLREKLQEMKAAVQYAQADLLSEEDSKTLKTMSCINVW